MRNTIRQLADIISSHDQDKIQRELRIIALSPKNSGDAQEQTAKEEQKKVLLLAQNFITQKGKPAENWRTSTTCFEALTDWFEQTTHIENHLPLSMMSWCCQLEQTLPNSINPNRIITLGSAYYAEPHKFMGFLYWLLESGVESAFIIQSTLLHRFFAYHAFEMTIIGKSYALLAKLSNRLDAFLSFLNNNSCGMRGFTNNTHDDGTYYSCNLLGTFFTHHALLRDYNLKETPTLYLESIHCHFAEQLFYLFGWELLKKLNYSDGTNQLFLQKLLQSEVKTKILSELPFNVLQGQFSISFTNVILIVIRQSYNPEELLAITLTEPFYIHAAGLNLGTFLFEPHLRTIINTLCTSAKYNTLHHLPFLATLASALSNASPITLSGTNWNTAEINLILKTIVDIILPYGNTIYDDAIQPIHNILTKLWPFFLEKMTQLARNIDTAIHDFNYNDIDYDTLTHTWGSQLSTCNLLFSLEPKLPQAASYPRTIYQLHARVLQNKCALCIADDELLPLESMLSNMTPDASTQKRILQETLIDPFSQAALIEAILNYRTPFFSAESLLIQAFGNTNSVLFHAFTTENETLSELLLINTLKKTVLPNGTLTALLDAAIEYNKVHYTKSLCNLNGVNQLMPNDIESALFGAAIQWEVWHVIGLLCGLSGDENVNPILIKANNIHLYFDVIKKYQEHYCTPVAPADAFQYKNDNDETPLHFAANHFTMEQFKNIFAALRITYSTEPQEIAALLNAQTKSNQRVECTTDHPEKEAINAFLHALRDEYKQYEEDASTVDEEEEEQEEDTIPMISRLFSPSDGRRRSRETTDSDETNDEFQRGPS